MDRGRFVPARRFSHEHPKRRRGVKALCVFCVFSAGYIAGCHDWAAMLFEFVGASVAAVAVAPDSYF
jgi:hypothetical protein